MSDHKPKYQKLKEYLKTLIKDSELKPGDRIPSENHLSEQFHISRHTVRKAFGELMNEGWLAAAQGKGTFVDSMWMMKSSENRIIGVMTTYLNDYIFPYIIRGIDQVLSKNGHNIVLCCTDNQFEKEQRCLDNLMKQHISGLIVETTKSVLPNPNLDFYRWFQSRNIPVLLMHGSYKGFSASSIYEDDVEAGYLAAKHLMELNHTAIGGVFKIDDIQGHARYEGFLKAHHEYKIPVHDNRIVWFDTSDRFYKLKRGGPIERLLNTCTGVVCYNDQICLLLLDIIREEGIAVPNQLSLVSFDDSDLAIASEIKLTTVAHPKERLGIEAANIMLKLLAEPDMNVQVKMKPELVVRNSTGPARQD